MEAIGLIEVVGLVAAIEAADVCTKAANVKILALNKVGSGIMTLTISGDVGAVKAAVDAGTISASRLGKLRASHVIPRISKDAYQILKDKPKVEVKSENKNAEIEETLVQDLAENPLVETISETVEENVEEIAEDLPKYSIKELKSIIKKLKPEMTYKELNQLKKADLIKLVQDFSGEDK